MSIWGTLIGGMLGFTIGGPIGALLGSFLGSKFSGGKVKSINFSNENSQQIFALALIILSAKISKADGVVTKDELLAIKEKLNIPDSEIDNVSKVFNVAKQDVLGFEPYAQQISQIYSKNKTALVEVLNILLYIAEADGEVSKPEIKMIREIGFIFNLSDIEINSLFESRKSSEKLNPYIVLGVKPSDDIKEIRKKYINLSKTYHPDLLINKGVPEEVIEKSKEKMRIINNAWDQIQKLKKTSKSTYFFLFLDLIPSIINCSHFFFTFFKNFFWNTFIN